MTVWSPQQNEALSTAAHNRVDMSGQRIGRLTVITFSHTSRKRKAVWLCRCDCGNDTEVFGTRLRSGHTTSCGCVQREKGDASMLAGQEANFKHGLVGTPTYKSWDAAKQRCFNPRDIHFPKYGAIGVTMCEEWRESFSAFLADMGPRPPGKTLDRWPDPFGNYEPGNCRWATPKEQANNRRPRRKSES